MHTRRHWRMVGRNVGATEDLSTHLRCPLGMKKKFRRPFGVSSPENGAGSCSGVRRVWQAPLQLPKGWDWFLMRTAATRWGSA